MVNEYFDLITYGGTLDYYVFELANFSALAFLLLVIYKLDFININSLIVWFGLFFSPLVFNYFLFSPWFFGDQFQYASEVISLKTHGIGINQAGSFAGVDSINAVTLSAKILGSFPLPNYMTVTSLAFTNKLILFITFLWFKRFFENENEVLLYFLIPSLVLYSSMALRDTLVIVISIIFIINLIRGRILLPILLLVPLFTLKIQMFAILSLYLMAHVIFQAHRSKALFSFFIVICFIGGFIFEDIILSILNLYRIAFAAEDFIAFDGSISYQAWALYGGENIESLQINSMFEAIYLAMLKLPILLLMPMPWNWSNIFYPIQSIESCLLIYLYFKLSADSKMYKNTEFILLTFILIVGLSIYALIMANEGTFVRYRFTLYYPFLLALLYVCRQSDRDIKNFNL
ncbi:hypothetical protein OAB49_00625 [Gammaproteobacteria bacterium]|nr:hypothetical protein [Gammaproteobacteria bacterium]